jgi:hypothetical protein
MNSMTQPLLELDEIAHRLRALLADGRLPVSYDPTLEHFKVLEALFSIEGAGADWDLYPVPGDLDVVRGWSEARFGVRRFVLIDLGHVDRGRVWIEGEIPVNPLDRGLYLALRLAMAEARLGHVGASVAGLLLMRGTWFEDDRSREPTDTMH